MENGSKTYKFMTNIIKGAMDQTRYMKSLEKITMDAQVSYRRLFIALGGLGVITVIYIVFGLSVGTKFRYTALPATIIYASLLVLIVNFLISSRTKSMLESAGRLALFPYFEAIRVKSKRAGNLKSVGIKSFKKGVITFRRGDVGLLYEIDGQLSMSTLPGTAEAISTAKAQYLIARTPDSQEQMIVSVKRIDTTNQLKNLGEYYYNQTNDPARDAWVKAMAGQIATHIDEYLSDDFIITESVIIRERNIAQLKKLKTQFEQAANSGLYAKYRLITDEEEVIKLLAPLTMMSMKGRQKTVKKLKESVQKGVKAINGKK